MSERYSRQIMLPEIGEEGQRQLSQSKVLIVGVGGLGSPVSLYLAGAGIGTVGLVDADTVSESNLQRQVLYTQSEVGEPKAMVAARRLQALNPECKVHPINAFFSDENAVELVAEYDLVIDCSDNFTTRYLIDDVCGQLGKSWIYGSIGEFDGQVAVFNHSGSVHFSDLFPDRRDLCALPRRTLGVIGPVPGVVGSIQACEAIKLLAGIPSPLDGRLFTINLKTMITNLIEI